MKIIFAEMTGSKVLVVPLVNPPLKFGQTNKHEIFGTLKHGDIVLLGGKGLKTVEWSSFFPQKKSLYDFVQYLSDEFGKTYVKFLEEHSEEPFRLIILEGVKTVRNMLVVVDSFEYEYDKMGNIQYSVKLVEFPDNASRI